MWGFMTPGARIQTAIDLLEMIEHPPDGRTDVPADTVVSGYMRGRRYIGSKDRRAISELVYGVLRHRAEIDWRLAGPAATTRLRVLAGLRILKDWTGTDLALTFDGGPYRPDPVTEKEMAALEEMLVERGARPPAVQANLPDWLASQFSAAFGNAAESEAEALHAPAPVDLRVNSLKGDRTAAMTALASAEVAAEPTPHSPVGLRLSGRTPLGNLAAYRDGLVEVQDEGSQLCALLTAAAPGETVLDYCAGAGGKTLALAAMMQNQGRIVATDIDRRRLRSLSKRAERAGVTMVETIDLSSDDLPDLGVFNRVLVDAPCSGSGAWRRHPEAPWRLTVERLDGYMAQQREILARAATHVQKGGCLIYVTCSLFPQENQAQVEQFLSAHGDFEAMAVDAVWRDCVGTEPPAVDAGQPGLLLTPHRSGTDGFYIALMQRAG
jgi:16S rRNA (cytosine967-C5)-methyltransferase